MRAGNYDIVIIGSDYRIREAAGSCRILKKKFRTQAAAVERAERMTQQDAAKERSNAGK